MTGRRRGFTGLGRPMDEEIARDPLLEQPDQSDPPADVDRVVEVQTPESESWCGFCKAPLRPTRDGKHRCQCRMEPTGK